MAAESWCQRWLASREATHTWTWMLLLAVSCWRLPLSSLFAGCIFLLTLAVDAQEKLEEEPENLPGEMKLKTRGKFFTRVQMALSVDLAESRWASC